MIHFVPHHEHLFSPARTSKTFYYLLQSCPDSRYAPVFHKRHQMYIACSTLTRETSRQQKATTRSQISITHLNHGKKPGYIAFSATQHLNLDRILQVLVRRANDKKTTVIEHDAARAGNGLAIDGVHACIANDPA